MAFSWGSQVYAPSCPLHTGDWTGQEEEGSVDAWDPVLVGQDDSRDLHTRSLLGSGVVMLPARLLPASQERSGPIPEVRRQETDSDLRAGLRVRRPLSIFWARRYPFFFFFFFKNNFFLLSPFFMVLFGDVKMLSVFFSIMFLKSNVIPIMSTIYLYHFFLKQQPFYFSMFSNSLKVSVLDPIKAVFVYR